MTSLPPMLRTAPRALILDFGGVVFQTVKRQHGRDEIAASLFTRLDRAGWQVDPERIRASLESGLTALGHWKHASSRRLTPREMSHREVVGDFLAASLPEGARAVLIAEAGQVLDDINTTLNDHEVRPGIRELLMTAQERGIRLGIVSNAHSGRSHRRLLAGHGLADYFGVQVYSDEVGMRKPHPRMITLAAAALGVNPADAWYVGDTQDRDVVAGRRAGVGAVVLTASKHTTNPPFPVEETADAVWPTPEGLATALRSATDRGARSERLEPTNDEAGRAALFIDHGGVISLSEPDDALMAEFCAHLARLLDGPEDPVTPARAMELVRLGKARHAHHKATQRENLAHGGTFREIDPVTYWRDLVGLDLSVRARAVLEAEAHDLMYRWGRAKSRRTMRPGIRELLEACRTEGMPVVVVSNTVSGRAVRAECAAHGIDHLIGAFVCSDENGHRKPDVRILDEALAVVGADPRRSIFIGDKPQNDGEVALARGFARRVIMRGGSTPDDEIELALADGVATDVVDNPNSVTGLIRSPIPVP